VTTPPSIVNERRGIMMVETLEGGMAGLQFDFNECGSVLIGFVSSNVGCSFEKDGQTLK